ncbi:FAD-dependent oxidoreductase [Brevibacterium jeotgali]|uniref:FAD-dependent oxidoreductase n=1 Tax=Brevibacterium jeotgali TaxID=1262550 RepID=UPI000C75D6C1|nr:FAD-dependent oxidoreductase [Brevibacterium jeotgali]
MQVEKGVVEATPRDVVVVGAGQAGLAVAYHLARAGADVLLVDESEQVGDSWDFRSLTSLPRPDGKCI